MWRVDGTSRNINRPAGVAFRLQISADSVEPTIASRSANLFSHDASGPDGADKLEKVRPQVPWIIRSAAFSCDRERLAGAACGPERPVVGPAGKPGGDRPSSGSGKEMALGEPRDVIGLYLLDRTGVHHAGRNDFVERQVAQHLRRDRVVLVVVASHAGLRSSAARGCVLISSSQTNQEQSIVGAPPPVKSSRHVTGRIHAGGISSNICTRLAA